MRTSISLRTSSSWQSQRRQLSCNCLEYRIKSYVYTFGEVVPVVGFLIHLAQLRGDRFYDLSRLCADYVLVMATPESLEGLQFPVWDICCFVEDAKLVGSKVQGTVPINYADGGSDVRSCVLGCFGGQHYVSTCMYSLNLNERCAAFKSESVDMYCTVHSTGFSGVHLCPTGIAPNMRLSKPKASPKSIL